MSILIINYFYTITPSKILAKSLSFFLKKSYKKDMVFIYKKKILFFVKRDYNSVSIINFKKGRDIKCTS